MPKVSEQYLDERPSGANDSSTSCGPTDNTDFIVVTERQSAQTVDKTGDQDEVVSDVAANATDVAFAIIVP